MESTINAAFSLDDFKITKFTLNTPKTSAEGVNISFNPSGKYYQSKGEYLLDFSFVAYYNERLTSETINIIEATMVSSFNFEEPIQFQEIPDFFYVNSIAIVYPHLRAFVSMVTSLTNSGRIILPILNLTSLESVLKDNTESFT